MLERAGYRCTIAPAGADLARTVAEANPNVALIGAGDQGGLEVVRRLKNSSQSRHIPVVAVDVGQGPDALHACYDAGADDRFESDAEETEILARLVTLVRLSGMETEMLRRAQTAHESQAIAQQMLTDVAPH